MKNDIKYIIKRIIIGVGIATGIMLVKSLPVFAEEKEYNYSICQGQFSASNVINSDYCYISGYSRNYYKYLKFNVPNTSIFLNLYFTEEQDSNYLVFYDEINESYIFYRTTSKAKFDFKMVWYENAYFDGHGPYNTRYFDKYNSSTGSTTFSETYYSNIAIFTSKSNTAFEEQFKKNITMSSGYKYMNKYNYEIDGQDYYFYTINEISPAYQDYIEGYNDYYNFTWKNYKLINKSMEHFYIDDTEKDVEEIKEVPDGYEMIDMLGKDAVLFYPKDFREIDNVCSETSSIIGGSVAMCNQFDYYYTFYLKGSFDTALKNLSLNSSEYDRVALENYTKATEYTKIVKSNYYDTGILFYPTNISSGTGSVASSEYKVYYDSSKLNYIIIDNIDDFTGEDINYIDKNGDEVSTKIDSVKKRTDIEYSGSDDFNVDYDESSIKSFDISSGFKSFINMLSDGVSFFKKYMGEFMKDIPQFVFYFVIFIPILSIVVAVIKIINR